VTYGSTTNESNNSPAESLEPASQTVYETAKSAAHAYNELREKELEKTANVLITDLFPPDMDQDDPDKVLASQTISSLAYDSDESAHRGLAQTQHNPKINIERVAKYVKYTEQLLMARPDTQFVVIHNAMKHNIDFLLANYKDQIHEPLQDAEKHPENYNPQIERLLERQKRLGDASRELIGSNTLRTDVTQLTEIAYVLW